MKLSLRDRIVREVNLLMLEGAWAELTTGQIADRILKAIGTDDE